MKNMIEQKKTTITTSMVIAMLVVTAMVISKLMGLSFADNTFVVSNGKYIITSEKNLTAQYAGVSKKSITSVNILATVKINGQTYKVTSIKTSALKGNKKVKKLTIGTNTKTIGKNAFYGCKNLKTVTISTTKLTNSSIKANAFKGLNSKAVVTVPEEKLTVYKKILKAKGLTGKKQTVKGKKMTDVHSEPAPEPTLDSNRDIPAPHNTRLSIGKSTVPEDVKKEADNYSIGDAIPITAGFEMDDKMYGEWTTIEKAAGYNGWIRCNECFDNLGRVIMFDNMDDYGAHVVFHIDGLYCGNVSFSNGGYFEKPWTAYHFVEDRRPCSTVIHINLPEGLSYKDGTLKVYYDYKYKIDSSAYRRCI